MKTQTKLKAIITVQLLTLASIPILAIIELLN